MWEESLNPFPPNSRCWDTITALLTSLWGRSKRVTDHEKVYFICHSSQISIIGKVTREYKNHCPGPKPGDQRMRRNNLKDRVMFSVTMDTGLEWGRRLNLE